MSKKKKTRAQKEHANIHRMQQLDNLVKLGDNMSSGMNSPFVPAQSAIVGSTRAVHVSPASPADSAESEYILGDIRKCLYLIVLFVIGYILVYFINQKTNFLNTAGTQILEFLIKK